MKVINKEKNDGTISYMKQFANNLIFPLGLFQTYHYHRMTLLAYTSILTQACFTYTTY